MKQLEIERKRIDKIDERILKLISERTRTAERIAEIKKRNRLPVKDAAREKLIKKKWEKNAKKLGVNEKIASKLLLELLKQSKETRQPK